MGKFKAIPIVVEAITFGELCQYIRTVAIIDTNPWCFEYKGHIITHQDDNCYIISTTVGFQKMTPEHMLITDTSGDIYICEINAFNKIYKTID